MGQLDRAWRVLARVARLLFERVLAWDVRVQGIEHVPVEGGAVLAFNHHGTIDVVFVAWAPVLWLGRPVRFLATAELFQRRRTGWLVRAVGAVPVERAPHRGTSRARAYARAVAALRDGELVAVAPEGTISDSFDLLPLRSGAARMAVEAGVPLVPAIGWGSHRAAAKGRRLRFRRHLPVMVHYGAPLHARRDETPVDLTARLRTAMTTLLDEVQRTYPVPVDEDGAWWVPARLGGGAPRHDQVVAANAERFAIERRAQRGADGRDVAS